MSKQEGLGEKSKATLNDTAVKGSQAAGQTYVDPLFYIDGQLCQHVRKIHQG